jgi:MOSC domain-containing protein YiiM
MKILSIQTGQLSQMTYRDRLFNTGIRKENKVDQIYIGKLGLEGDLIGNLDVHGGEGRAVYAFSRSSYELWKGKIKDELLSQHGLFGENLTLDHIEEESIRVGDEFEVGSVRLQATSPRFPCFIFADRVGFEKAQDYMNETRRSGVLFRVLQTGQVKIGDSMKLVKSSPYNLKVADFLIMGNAKNITRESMDFFRTIPVIPKITIDRLEYRLIHGR